MRVLCCEDDFECWRDQARQLLVQGVPPHAVVWEDEDNRQLFAAEPLSDYDCPVQRLRVPATLLADLKSAAR